MTDERMVEGGLDEPDELEPAQGSLDLASPDDTATVADWEAAAAAVLRKAERLGDDDPDDLVWEKLDPDHARRHRDHPARHARPARRPGDQRPADPPGRLGRPRARPRRRRRARQRGGAGRPRRRRDQPLAAGERRRDLGVAARRRAARPGAGRPRRRRPRRRSSRTPATASCTPPPTSASPASDATADAGAARPGSAGIRGFVVDAHRGARPRRLRRPGARLVDGGRRRRTCAR